MKKFLGLITILLLISIPVLSQNSDPATINFSFQYEAGISLVISETLLDWGIVPLLVDPILNEDWFACPTIPQIVISFKLPTANRAQLVAETPDLFTYNGSTDKNPSMYMKHEITGEFTVAETPLPDPVDGQVVLWTSTANGGKRVGDMIFKVWVHEEFGGVITPFSGAIIYTVLDIVI